MFNARASTLEMGFSERRDERTFNTFQRRGVDQLAISLHGSTVLHTEVRVRW